MFFTERRDPKSRFAVLLYPSASLQEITCLTAALSVWYGESIDYIAGEDKEYRSEEGLRLLPTKTAAEADPANYDCVILPGTIDPLPALHDEALVAFLRRGIGTNTVFAAISSAPLLLCRAGLLKGKKFTAGFFMQMVDVFPFVEKKNFVHQGVVTDGNVITGIGMFYRAFAETVLRRFGFDTGKNFMRAEPENYTEDDLTFYWTEDEYREFLEEWKEYEK